MSEVIETPIKNLLTIADAILHGRLADAALKVKQEKSIATIAPLLEKMANLNAAPPFPEKLVGFENILATDYDFLWSAGHASSTRDAVINRLVRFDHLKKFESGDKGLRISVVSGERTQIRYDFADGAQTSVFTHYVLKTRFTDTSEIFAAIRWLHGNANEEVILRFRPTTVVLGQRIELNHAHAEAFSIVSIGRHDGADVIFLNGFPLLWRPATTSAPTGITIDFIGSSQGTSNVDLLLFMVAKKGLPLFCQGMEFRCWAEEMILAYSHKRDLTGLSRWLHAFEALDFSLSEHVYSTAIAANLKETHGYRDYLSDLLIQKLPQEKREPALQNLAPKEPAVIVKVEDACVKIASNPSQRASLRYLFRKRPEKIELLGNINLRAYSGDILGIIGKNGAGKSTFLKALVAGMPLSDGKISAHGKPLLLRPGAGMQGDLTGRENVLKTGLYMGFLPQEIYKMMEEIISFAELEDHIDRPFRYYSDGMKARLIFSLATSIPRDILLLDELLSAGDMGFQRKAVKRLDEFIAKAKLVFVVQHTFDFVLSKCTKCLLLDHGRPVYFGDPFIATEIYKESL